MLVRREESSSSMERLSRDLPLTTAALLTSTVGVPNYKLLAWLYTEVSERATYVFFDLLGNLV
jgi:hypothetical protein